MSSFLIRSAGVLGLALVTGACGSSPGSLVAPSASLPATATNQGPVNVGGAGTASVHTTSPSPRTGEAEVEFRGAIESITPPTLQVAGQMVTTDSSTVILRGDTIIGLADLHVGDLVEVEGASTGGVALASKIKVEDASEAEVELRGTIESITPPSLHVAGQIVTTDSTTLILRDDTTIGLADLLVGELVEVEGASIGGVVLASKIKVEDDAASDDHGGNRGGGSSDDGASGDDGTSHGGGSGDDGSGDDGGHHGGGSGSGGNGSGGN